MKRPLMYITATTLFALSLTACGGSDDSSPEDESPSAAEASESQSAGAEESNNSTTEATPVDARVEVTSDGGASTHTIKERGGADVKYDQEFEDRAEIEFDNDIESVYVVSDDEEAQVTCTVWYGDEEVASDEASGEPARCWAPPAEG